MYTDNHGKKSHVCQHILYSGIGGKAYCASTRKYIFFKKVLVIINLLPINKQDAFAMT
jgi:hypothetical protein